MQLQVILPVFREYLFYDHLPEQAEYVRASGELVSLVDLFSAGCSADDVAFLEHQHFLIVEGQIIRTDKTVVTASNNNGIVRAFLGNLVWGLQK